MISITVNDKGEKRYTTIDATIVPKPVKQKATKSHTPRSVETQKYPFNRMVNGQSFVVDTLEEAKRAVAAAYKAPYEVHASHALIETDNFDPTNIGKYRVWRDETVADRKTRKALKTTEVQA